MRRRNRTAFSEKRSSIIFAIRMSAIVLALWVGVPSPAEAQSNFVLLADTNLNSLDPIGFPFIAGTDVAFTADPNPPNSFVERIVEVGINGVPVSLLQEGDQLFPPLSAMVFNPQLESYDGGTYGFRGTIAGQTEFYLQTPGSLIKMSGTVGKRAGPTQA